MRTFVAILSFFLSLSSLIYASSITVTTNLDPIFQAAEQADDTTLFIFDVDDVLVVPSDQILLASHKKDADGYEAHYRKNYSEKKCHHLWSIARKGLNPRLIDSKILNLLSLLQQKHIKTIALTNAGTGKFGTIPYVEDLRIQELQCVGLDFRSAFAVKKYIKFYVLQPQADQKRLPMYKKGILFTCNVSKGKVLESFLKRIKWKPAKIVFTDDKMKHVESVQDFCQRVGIPFQGFQYTGVEQLSKPPLNKERADLQFKILADQGKWLSDAEADKLLAA
jgi:hypothetical protein